MKKLCLFFVSFVLFPCVIFADSVDITLTDDDVIVDQNKNIIYDIKLTKYPTAEKFRQIVTTSGQISFTDANDEVIGDNDMLKTGDIMVITFNDAATEKYTLSIKGDVLREGITSDNSAKEIAKHIINKNEITKDDCLKSADYNGDGKIKMNDAVTILKNKDNPLVLKFPNDVSVSVNKGFVDRNSSDSVVYLYPAYKKATQTETKYYYDITETGGYQFLARGEGYYTYCKNFVVDNLNTKKTIDANPGRMAGNGWESSNDIIYAFTDEMIDKISFADAIKESSYSFILDVPAFSATKAKHEFSNATDIKNFIDGLNDSNDNLYVFSAGSVTVNGEKLNIPLVIFTKVDISECERITNPESAVECAAVLINEDSETNSKVTIGYTAQVHGNESAATEGALAMIKSLDDEYGNQILNSVNIYIVPQYNVSGSKANTRQNYNNKDVNRDQLFVSQIETQAIHRLYNLFMPEAVIDTHEQQVYNYTNGHSDVSIGISHNNNSSSGLNLLSENAYTEIINNVANDREVRDNITSEGLNVTVFNGVCNSTLAVIGRPYFGLYGSLSLLVETRGIYGGKELLANRVLSQYITCREYFNYIVNHVTTIKSTVQADRNMTAFSGSIYNPNNLLTLKHGTFENEDTKVTYHRRTFNLQTGVYTTSDKDAYWKDRTLSYRTRPTAYLIAKDTDNVDTVIDKLKINGISCYVNNDSVTYKVLQYTGNGKSASLGEEKNVLFANGVYVCPMNQVGGNILAMSMEPDVADTYGYNGSFVQSGLLKASDIYRSQTNLSDSSDSDAIDEKKLPKVLD